MKDSGIEWIGEIPESWSTIPFRHILKERQEKNSPVKTTERLSLSIDLGVTLYAEKTTNLDRFKEDFEQYKLAHIGDLVMNSMNMIVGATGVSAYYGCVSPVYYTFYDELPDHATAKYCEYIFRSKTMLRVLYSLGKGIYAIVRGDDRVNTCRLKVAKEDLKSIPIPLPTIEEQRSIIAFLDRQCGLIDNVIEKTKASVEEYKKLRQAVITQAVTKGVRGDRPMKNSGIEWIGEIPQEWEVTRIKNIFSLRDERNSLPLEEVNLISLYTDKGVLQHSDIEKTTGNKASNADGYKLVYENDIVVNIILCWMGAIGRSAYNGVTSPAYDIYVPSDKIECEYYHHYFRTSGFSGDCFKRGRGIMLMRWRTYSDQFRDIRVPCPPITEQREILAYLNKKCTEIDTLITKKEQFLTELESYKKSMIYEYVTGKKEVPQS